LYLFHTEVISNIQLNYTFFGPAKSNRNVGTLTHIS